MKKKVTGEHFVSMYVSNAFAENPKTNTQLAKEMNICERRFYELLREYSDDIEKDKKVMRNHIFAKAIKALGRELDRSEVHPEYLKIAFGISDYLRHLEQTTPVIQQNIVNLISEINGLSIDEVRSRINQKLQEARQINRKKLE